MLRKIKVYGKLRQILGQSTFEADLNNVGQAFSFLYNNFPEIQKDLLNNNYRIWTGDKLVTEEKIFMSGEKDIRIIPVATGSGFIAPFVAPVLGSVFGGGISTFIGGLVGGGVLGSVVGALGTSLIISGVNSLLTPQPTQQTVSGMDPTDPASLASNYSFSGITNISRSGVPINLIYGETIVGSVTVSNGIDTVQVRGDA
tara:strand:+ start:383 stop:982 length:600 start_codon:yes stop_codon:yes gene_type:complete